MVFIILGEILPSQKKCWLCIGDKERGSWQFPSRFVQHLAPWGSRLVSHPVGCNKNLGATESNGNY